MPDALYSLLRYLGRALSIEKSLELRRLAIDEMDPEALALGGAA